MGEARGGLRYVTAAIARWAHMLANGGQPCSLRQIRRLGLLSLEGSLSVPAPCPMGQLPRGD